MDVGGDPAVKTAGRYIDQLCSEAVHGIAANPEGEASAEAMRAIVQPLMGCFGWCRFHEVLSEARLALSGFLVGLY